MKRRRRIYFTEAQKAEIWDRWQRGESMSSIGRIFERDSSSIHPLISRTGGFRPEPRKRGPLALSLSEREEISRGLGADQSYRCIASHLRRAPSTISREVIRNGGRKAYRATRADAAAWARALRPKPCKLACNKALCRTVSAKLRQQWSPQQIAGWLKKQHPDDEAKRVSHETIYRSLFVQARGALKKELISYLRSPRSMRRPRASSLRQSGLGQIKDMASIRERPAAVEDRAVPVHWEGDLIAGSKGSHIVTLVERHTRYLMLAKVDSRDTETVIAALIKQSKKLPKELYKSPTWDRGKELSDHKRFTLATDIQVYFVIRKAPGNADRTRTPTGCCASTSRKAPICLSTRKLNSTLSPDRCMSAQKKRWTMTPQLSD